jgi:hypothetical protein
MRAVAARAGDRTVNSTCSLLPHTSATWPAHLATFGGIFSHFTKSGVVKEFW